MTSARLPKLGLVLLALAVALVAWLRRRRAATA